MRHSAFLERSIYTDKLPIFQATTALRSSRERTQRISDSLHLRLVTYATSQLRRMHNCVPYTTSLVCDDEPSGRRLQRKDIAQVIVDCKVRPYSGRQLSSRGIYVREICGSLITIFKLKI